MVKKMDAKPKVVVIIEARMGSSRLPGKVLKDVNGRPALERLIARLKFCKKVDEIVVATTTSEKDDALVAWATQNNVSYFRGSEDDVLKRVADASQEYNADLIVEITGDCILTDPGVIDQAVQTFLVNSCDVVTNCGEYLSYPMGVYAQVFRASDLVWVSDNISDLAVREHVSLYFYENPDTYKIFNLVAPAEVAFKDWRLQLDYQEDLDLLNEIYKRLEPPYGDNFGLSEICSMLKDNLHLLDINSHCIEKSAR